MPAVVVVVVLGLVAACTGRGALGPTTEPTPTVASPPPSASEPDMVKPVRPEAMDLDDAEGAAAAAEYFIELYPYVMRSGDTAEFEAMSHEACGFCAQALDDAAQIQRDGNVYVGGDVESTLLNVYVRDDLTGVIPLDFRVHQASSSTVDTTGNVVSSAAEQTTENRVEIGQIAGEWVIVGIAPRPES